MVRTRQVLFVLFTPKYTFLKDFALKESYKNIQKTSGSNPE
jgi:hypothetical protein